LAPGAGEPLHPAIGFDGVRGIQKNLYNHTHDHHQMKIESKIVRALRAWHPSADIQPIHNGWKAGWLQVHGQLSDDAIPQVNPGKIAQLVRENCSDAAMITADHEEE
jgi:hypothetical protein